MRLDVRPPVDVCQTCGTGQGYIWPIATDGDTTHQWVERCDNCDRFEHDFEAAAWISERLKKEGINAILGHGFAGGMRRETPYVEVVE